VNRQAGLVAGQCQGAAYLRRYVVVVDDEIDAYDINDVLWAMCNRAEYQKSLMEKWRKESFG
jgi:4-hydroxy-3-polyprenylbenzoate decarboxylase